MFAVEIGNPLHTLSQTANTHENGRFAEEVCVAQEGRLPIAEQVAVQEPQEGRRPDRSGRYGKITAEAWNCAPRTPMRAVYSTGLALPQPPNSIGSRTGDREAEKVDMGWSGGR